MFELTFPRCCRCPVCLSALGGEDPFLPAGCAHEGEGGEGLGCLITGADGTMHSLYGTRSLVLVLAIAK